MPTAPRVATTAGPVSGTALEGFERYLGIPYARPPVGGLRFAPPQAAEPWSDPLVCDRFGPHAPQKVGMMETVLGGGAQIVVSEAECLRVNVWTPAADGRSRPVMVWIHGGAFVMGTSGTPWYDGARFAVDQDVVVVSLNYRLGVTGFTYLADIAGPQVQGSGSLGVQDAAAALRWVRDNIAAFGGDPGNVTVFGESAGAMSVGTLIGLPEAAGLFHRAILQSGASSNVSTAERAAGFTRELIEILGIAATADPLSALRSMDIDTLLDAHRALEERHPLGNGLVSQPVVDGVVLDRPPLEAVAAGSAATVPLLIGTNADEWRLFAMIDPDSGALGEDQLVARVGRLGVADPVAMIATYRRRLPEAQAADVFNAVMSDATFRMPAIRLAEAQSRGGGRAWMYLFTWTSPQFDGALGSCHALEIPFVFNTVDRPGASLFIGDDPPVGIAERMNTAWADFARHGRPDGAGFGDWPAYTPGERATMVIDTESHLDLDPLADERRAWDTAG